MLLEWVSAVLSPIVGAGASSVFKRWINAGRARSIPKEPPTTLGALGRQVRDMEEWQADAQEVLLAQERKLQKLRKEIRGTRLLVDVFLVLLFAAVLMWYFWARHLPQ